MGCGTILPSCGAVVLPSNSAAIHSSIHPPLPVVCWSLRRSWMALTNSIGGGGLWRVSLMEVSGSVVGPDLVQNRALNRGYCTRSAQIEGTLCNHPTWKAVFAQGPIPSSFRSPTCLYDLKRCTSVVPVLYQCCISVVPVLHQCCASVVPVLYQRCSSAAPGFDCLNGSSI